MNFSTRVTDLLGIRYPIVQAGMSWASSNAELALAVSQAGALGMIAAGPFDRAAFLYSEDLDLGLRATDAGIEAVISASTPLV